MLLTMPPVLGDFFKIAGQHRDDLLDIGAFVLGQPGNHGPCRLL